MAFRNIRNPIGLTGTSIHNQNLKTGVFSRKSNTLTTHDISTGRFGLSWPEKLNEDVDSGTIFYINNAVSLCSLCHLNFNDRLNLGLFDLDYFFLTKRSTTCHHSWVLRWWLDQILVFHYNTFSAVQGHLQAAHRLCKSLRKSFSLETRSLTLDQKQVVVSVKIWIPSPAETSSIMILPSECSFASTVTSLSTLKHSPPTFATSILILNRKLNASGIHAWMRLLEAQVLKLVLRVFWVFCDIVRKRLIGLTWHFTTIREPIISAVAPTLVWARCDRNFKD